MKILFRMTFAVALVMVLTATGLWAAGGSDSSAAAADKKYVTDPTTGKVVVAPQYGGSIAQGWPGIGEHADTWWGGGARELVTLVLEKMGIADWATPRDIWDFKNWEPPPSVHRGLLAENYDISPDGLTFTFHIRKGVHWQDKPR